MMRRFLSYILAGFCSLQLWAEPYRVETLPALDNTTRVSNPDHILSQSTIDSINSILLTLDKHEIQTLVVVVKNIYNDDPYSFAIGLGRRFGVGGKKSLGIVIVLATDDRSYYISTGNGMEAYLPDAICKRIEERAMMPYLRQGDWNQAMLAAVSMMRDYIEREPELMEQIREEDATDEAALWAFIVFLLGSVGILVGIACYHAYQQKKCPQCGHHKLVRIASKTKRVNGQLHVYKTYRCSHCHHQLIRDQIYRTGHNLGAGGIFIGGGGRGFGGGSGFGGGGFSGFGGGSFGGGGAGGRF